MSLAIVHSRAQIGVEAPAVTVEVHMANGLPSLTLVGLPETAVKESKESVEGYLGMMGKFAADRHTALITGVPIRQEVHHQKRYFNGITVVGEGDGTYLKQKLVPFGEYVPLQDMLRGLIAFFDLPMSRLTPTICAASATAPRCRARCTSAGK